MNTQQTLRVMALDDEPFMLKLLSHLLNDIGFSQVVTCDNGHEALKVLVNADTTPDIILLDLNMPEMDGVEFIRHLVKHNFEGSLILVSGEDQRVLQSAENLVRAHKLSVLGHLSKPVKPDALTALLKGFTAHLPSQPRTARAAYTAKELQHGITNDELTNYYQPKVSLKTGEVVGVETLVRWSHPSDGLVMPDQFVTLTEINQLIDKLTNSVLNGALKQAADWQKSGLKLNVAINLSMDNLSSLEFADIIESRVRAAGISPDTLILEITESRLMQDIKPTLDILTRLRIKRFRLSIDDFGTGHSSLSQLRDIPFNELKIDRGFVHNASSDTTTRAIFNASLKLAKQLDMIAVAEGVETVEDWEFLRQTDCDHAQGYLIGRPMPASEIPEWIEQWKNRYQDMLSK